MKKGQKIKYKDKYYFIQAVIRRKHKMSILVKKFDNTHIEIPIELLDEC